MNTPLSELLPQHTYLVTKLRPDGAEVSCFSTNSKCTALDYAAIGWSVLMVPAWLTRAQDSNADDFSEALSCMRKAAFERDVPEMMTWQLRVVSMHRGACRAATPAAALPKPPPYAAIGNLLNQAMDKAVDNGANSVSMPDELVEIAAWLCGVNDYAASPVPPAPATGEQTLTFEAAWLADGNSLEIRTEYDQADLEGARYGWMLARAALSAPQAAPATGSVLTDRRIAELGIEHGHGCDMADTEGFENDVLWFDGSLIPFARSVEKECRALAAKGDQT